MTCNHIFGVLISISRLVQIASFVTLCDKELRRTEKYTVAHADIHQRVEGLCHNYKHCASRVVSPYVVCVVEDATAVQLYVSQGIAVQHAALFRMQTTAGAHKQQRIHDAVSFQTTHMPLYNCLCDTTTYWCSMHQALVVTQGACSALHGVHVAELPCPVRVSNCRCGYQLELQSDTFEAYESTVYWTLFVHSLSLLCTHMCYVN
jgi:hypothetical protein